MGCLWLLLAAVGAQRVLLKNYRNVSGIQVLYSVEIGIGTPLQQLDLMLEMSSTVKII